MDESRTVRALRLLCLRALWPSFLVAALATGLLSAVLAPPHVAVPAAGAWSARAVYSALFLVQWLACWAASCLGLWLLTSRPEGPGDVFEDREPED